MILIFWCVFLLFIWFKTDFFISYGRLLGLKNLLKIEKWEEYRILNPKISYLEYLSIKHRNFFTKLISCVVCILFWIVLTVCLLTHNLYYLPVIYIISYLIFKIIDKYV
jgi:hypothetical protein